MQDLTLYLVSLNCIGVKNLSENDTEDLTTFFFFFHTATYLCNRSGAWVGQKIARS